jgi:hypothetical protein
VAVQRLIRLLALAAGVAASAGPSFGSPVRPLFLSGQPAPAGLPFASFGRAAVNAHGTVCFMAGWDSLQHRPEGLFLRRGGQVLPIARAGDPIPNDPGQRFSFPPNNPDELTSFSLNNQDQVAFIARDGLYLYDDQGVRPIARIGDAVPDAPDERWDEIDAVSLNNSGAIAFSGAVRSVQDGERQEGVFLATGASVQIVLFDGDTVPNLDGPLDGVASVSLNDAGQIATLGLEGDDELTCVLLTTADGTRAIAVEEQPAPGGGVWTELDSAALNNPGTVVFEGRVQTDTGEHGGIYRSSGETVMPVALPGQAVMGTGSVLADGLGRPIVDDAGHVAVVASLAGAAPRQALVLAADGALSALALAGEPAPGDLKGTIARFSGLNLGSLGAGGIVCGTALDGAPVSDSILQYALAGEANVIITTAALLPPGGVLTLTDAATPSRMVQAHVNRRGDVVFAADVGGYGRALFRAGAAEPELLTPLGQGGASVTSIRSVTAFDLNDAGQIAYLGAWDEADQDTAIFTTTLGGSGAPSLLAATGQAAPTVPVRTMVHLGPPLIDGSGGVVFAAQARTESGASAAAGAFLLRAAPGHLELLAAEGQAVTGVGSLAEAPDAEAGSASSLFRELQMSRDGQVLFFSSYLEKQSGVFVPTGLFLLSGGALSAVALPGQKPALEGGFSYTDFTLPRLSDRGAVTFAATLVGPRRKTRAGLFRQTDQDFLPIVSTGDPSPGLDGTHFSAFPDLTADAAADVAFFALLDTPPAAGSSGALFISAGGVTRLALPDGAGVDGLAGAAISSDASSPASPLSLQDDGTLLVAAHLRGGGVPDGLFLVQPFKAD